MQTEHYCERCGVLMDRDNHLPICSKCAWAEDATEPLTPIDDGYSEDEWYEDDGAEFDYDDYWAWVEQYELAPSLWERVRRAVLNLYHRMRAWWHRDDPDWIPF